MAPSFDVAVQQFLDHLRVERELTPATVEAYGARPGATSRSSSPRATSRTARDVRTIDVLDYLARLTEQKLSARSQARRLVALRQLFRVPARPSALCDADPTEDIDLPRFGRKLPDVPDASTRSTACWRRPTAARRAARATRAMLETLYATGLRVSELVQAAPRAT